MPAKIQPNLRHRDILSPSATNFCFPTTSQDKNSIIRTKTKNLKKFFKFFYHKMSSNTTKFYAYLRVKNIGFCIILIILFSLNLSYYYMDRQHQDNSLLYWKLNELEFLKTVSQIKARHKEFWKKYQQNLTDNNNDNNNYYPFPAHHRQVTAVTDDPFHCPISVLVF